MPFKRCRPKLSEETVLTLVLKLRPWWSFKFDLGGDI